MEQHPSSQSERSQRKAESGAAESPEIAVFKAREEYRDLMTGALENMREARELGKGIKQGSAGLYDKAALEMKAGYDLDAAEVLIKAMNVRMKLTELLGAPRSEQDLVDTYKSYLQLYDTSLDNLENNASDKVLAGRLRTARRPIAAEHDALSGKLREIHPNEDALQQDDDGNWVEGTLTWSQQKLDGEIAAVRRDAGSLQSRHMHDAGWQQGTSTERQRHEALQKKIAKYESIKTSRARVKTAPESRS